MGKTSNWDGCPAGLAGLTWIHVHLLREGVIFYSADPAARSCRCICCACIRRYSYTADPPAIIFLEAFTHTVVLEPKDGASGVASHFPYVRRVQPATVNKSIGHAGAGDHPNLVTTPRAGWMKMKTFHRARWYHGKGSLRNIFPSSSQDQSMSYPEEAGRDVWASV